MSSTNTSPLAQIIPPEILGDRFYHAILQLARSADLHSVLEIGSSSGAGSTDAFVRGLRDNPNHPALFCMEVSTPRFRALADRYAGDPFVHCYHASSVPLEAFPTEDQVAHFYRTTPTRLNQFPLEQVLGWLRADLAYVRDAGVPGDGIARIKREHAIEHFDLVLIDGSEFTGVPELNEVYGARYLMLDDVMAHKNYANYQRLRADPNYLLREENLTLRNGYAIFERLYHDSAALVHAEQAERLLVRNLVRPGMVVFDVGANIGDYTILFSKLVGPTGMVYAFEPSAATFETLRQRIQTHGCANVRLFQNAAYSHTTPLAFHEFPEGFSAWNSLGTPSMDDPKDYSKKIPIARTVTVQAVALDEFCRTHGIAHIDYCKIDVEGAESDALRGAHELLDQGRIGLLQFEISVDMLKGMGHTAQQTFDLLAASGYHCHQISPEGKIGRPVTGTNARYENFIAQPPSGMRVLGKMSGGGIAVSFGHSPPS